MRNQPAHEDVKDILPKKLETFKLRIKVAKSEKSFASQEGQSTGSKNWRGIFVTSVIRTIFMKIL